MATYEAALQDVTSQAIIEAAQRFTCGDVPGQSITFAPSIAEFVHRARLIHETIPLRGRPRLAYERPEYVYQSPKDRARMGFKMSVLSCGIGRRQVERVAAANKAGLDDMMAIAQEWGVPIPEILFHKSA